MVRRIIGSILFTILFLLIAIGFIFYLDLANGPIVLFILEIFLIVLLLPLLFIRVKNVILKHRISIIIIFVVASLGIAFTAHPSTYEKSAAYYSNPASTEVLQLKNGKVKGVFNKDKTVEIYAKIPYAKPPVGELRWKEPQPVENWDGILNCSKFGPRAMQPKDSPVMNTLVDMYALKGWYPDFRMEKYQKRSEDALYLNIWRPSTNATNLPILMYLHGGSLTTGSSAYNDYNGEEIAKRNVIMITIDYRLGVFGYFAHSDLAEESPNKTTGNYGLLDQIEALKWINENAEYFGGDKNNITVAGESAGSSSVSAICTSPLAKGLFKNAIGESSSIAGKNPPHTFRTMEEAKKTGLDIMKEFKCNSIEEMRKIPAEKLVTTNYSNGSMTIDGYALEKKPYEVYKEKNNNESILLNGYNVKESDAFVVPMFLTNPTNKNNILGRLKDTFGDKYGQEMYDLYKEKIDKNAFEAFNEIISVYWFIYPHHEWSQLAKEAGVTVYRYQFTKENKYYGTYHSGEMVYAYNSFDKSLHKFAYNSSDYELGKIMCDYWANFAKTGNPNSDGLPTWDIYEPESNQVMELGSHVGSFDDSYIELYKIFDEYYQK